MLKNSKQQPKDASWAGQTLTSLQYSEQYRTPPSSHRILGGVTGGLESWPGEKGVLAISSGTGPRMWPDARATCMQKAEFSRLLGIRAATYPHQGCNAGLFRKLFNLFYGKAVKLFFDLFRTNMCMKTTLFKKQIYYCNSENPTSRYLCIKKPTILTVDDSIPYIPYKFKIICK